MKRSVTVDLDELFDNLCYYDQISLIADKIKVQLLEDKLKIFNGSLTYVEKMEFFKQNIDAAIKVLKAAGYEIQ